MKRFIVLLIVVGTLLLPQAATAFSLGVSPATANLEAIPGSTVETILMVSTSSEQDLILKASAEGEMKKWITFQPADMIISKDKPLEVKVRFKVPRFARKRLYTDIITFSTSIPNSDPVTMGSTIVTAVAIKVGIDVVKEGDLSAPLVVPSSEESTEQITGAASGIPPSAKIVDERADTTIVFAALIIGFLAAVMLLLLGKIKK